MKISTVDKNHSELESVKKNQKHGPDSHSIWHMVINSTFDLALLYPGSLHI